MFTERKTRSAEVNITYSMPTCHGWQNANVVGLAGGGAMSSVPSAAANVHRVCATCGGPLSGRQQRACSTSCAGKLAPVRRQDGVHNGNYRGGISKQRVRYTREFYARNPHILRAHRAVADAIRRGALVRPSACGRCGSACRPHAHHADYALPLAVEWVCPVCHVRLNKPRHDRVPASEHAGSVRRLRRVR